MKPPRKTLMGVNLGGFIFKNTCTLSGAYCILILLWGFTGYCFAQRYVQAPWWGCALTSIVFVVIVIQIERQIILTVGKNRWASIFRVFIAAIMAVLGSSIIDQIIFGSDIDRKVVEITDKEVHDQVGMRLFVIDEKIAQLQTEIDSLDKATIELNELISITPTITTVESSVTQGRVQQSDGTYTPTSQTTVTRKAIPNPRIQQVNTNNDNLERLRKQQEEYTQKKMSVEESLREELKGKVGFLVELRAMYEIVASNGIALVFYLTVFAFLMSLELFIVVSKWGDVECDYDEVVKHQLEMRKSSLKELKK